MDIVKDIGIFGAGIGTGFLLGWIFLKKKYKKISDKEIEEVREYYSKKCEKKEEKKPDREDIENLKKVAETGDLGPSSVSQTSVPLKTNYHRIGDEEVVLAEKESPEEDMPTKPFLITADEFLNGENEYEKLSLTYYGMDDTLADDYGELVDIEETISSDIYNELGQITEDLYVRNPILETDYEIVHVDRAYTDRYMQ